MRLRYPGTLAFRRSELAREAQAANTDVALAAMGLERRGSLHKTARQKKGPTGRPVEPPIARS